MAGRNNSVIVTVGSAVAGAAFVLLNHHLHWEIPRPPFDYVLMKGWGYKAAVAGWVIFSLYWEFAARNATEAVRSESKASRGVHVFLANVAVLLVMLPLRDDAGFLRRSVIATGIGLGVESAGLLGAFWARRHLGRHWSGEITIKEGHELIRSGPYAVVRHPIYTGLLAMYVGAAIVTGKWLALVGVALAGFAYWRKVRLEEANLAVAFGAAYGEYRRESWAIVPWVF